MIKKLKEWWLKKVIPYKWWRKGLCTKHGVEKITHGYEERVDCPICLRERNK